MSAITIQCDIEAAHDLLMAEEDARELPTHPAAYEKWRVWLGDEAVAIGYPRRVLVQGRNPDRVAELLKVVAPANETLSIWSAIAQVQDEATP